MKYIIIGGVAGGATAAAKIRREDEHAEIIMFERGEYISYANCGLPYYIGGKIEKREDLIVQGTTTFSNRYDIDVRTFNEITSIDTSTKKVTVRNVQNGKIYFESYDKLLLSPGAMPFKPSLPGIDDPRILTVRTIPDTDKIKSLTEKTKKGKAVIVGGGFIGLEMAENLKALGFMVTIVEMIPQVMTQLDPVMASIVHNELRENGVELILGEAVMAFRPTSEKLYVQLKSGREISADLVILSIGVKAETSLAREAGLKIGVTGGIEVNDFLQTSNNDIYATGDAVEIINPITGDPSLTPLAGPANKQARIAATNMVHGNICRYKGSIGTGIAKIFRITAAVTGVNEKTLNKKGIKFISTITHSGSHAGYYPGSESLSIKILYSPKNGKLFGGQVVGYGGVDKRIDIIATIIGQNGTVYDLMEIEHAYAPPFSSAKDPVNMAGFVADNVINGKVKIVTWDIINNFDFGNDYLLDVRSPEECKQGMIKGAVNIPLEELRLRLDEIPSDKRIIVYCAIGMRGYLASRILLQNGYGNTYNLTGGYKTYLFSHKDQEIMTKLGDTKNKS